MSYSLGIDIGSTTAKAVLIDESKNILFKTYERHFSKVLEKCSELFDAVYKITGECEIAVSLSGSAGLGIAEAMRVPFIQEVVSESELVKYSAPDTSCIIELGGEDAKVIFLMAAPTKE